jgi:hypothetical protein
LTPKPAGDGVSGLRRRDPRPRPPGQSELAEGVHALLPCPVRSKAHAHSGRAPEQARRLAKGRLAEVTRGGDPAGERHRSRHAPDMAAVIERYRGAPGLQEAKYPHTGGRLAKAHHPTGIGKMKAEAVTRPRHPGSSPRPPVLDICISPLLHSVDRDARSS